MPISAEKPDARAHYDVAVIGAGPAGLAAAGAAAVAGARVLLLDSAPRPGGQYWRHRAGDDGAGHAGWPAFQRLQHTVNRFAEVIDVRAGSAVWQVTPLHANVFELHVTDSGAGATATPPGLALSARSVVLATGAYDRQLPFPGWTLPGVFTAGGVQALLKGSGVLAGRRIAVAGTGPFLLAVAAGLITAGAQLVGVFEAGGSPAGVARRPAAVARNPAKIIEGARYAAVLARARVPYRTRTAVVAATGVDSVSGVVVARLDRGWHVVPGSERTVDCDTLAVGYGFTPQLELAVQLGCDTRLDADGSLVGRVDDQQASSRPGVYLAGELTGVGGAVLAALQGELAGRAAAAYATGRPPKPVDSRRPARRLRAQRAFAAALQAAYPVPPGWISWSRPDTVVCRCEEVTVGEIGSAIDELGAADPRAVKLYARPGMGLCQGRVCGYATTALVAAAAGRVPTEADLQGVASRPIAAPVSLGALAAAHRQDLAARHDQATAAESPTEHQRTEQDSRHAD